MSRMQFHSVRRTRGDVAEHDLAPLVARTLLFLENSPRGASRKDILAAMNLNNAVWPSLRDALEATGEVVSVGRGPGLRHVHERHAHALPEDALRISQRAQRSQDLEEARMTLRQVLRTRGEIDSVDAQKATGLKADPVRRLLLELVDEGKVMRRGKKRSTKYRWVG
ncbi:MAG: hypothetical protein H6733_08290 [Alphaproteobacteria bacterium]|nr:hypothetical protein [Alphaproteobacteria bacterium]